MADQRYKRLTILHSNDLHGDFLPTVRDGVVTGGVSLLYKRVGRGTAAMAALAPGDAVDLMGPLGRGFPVPPPDAAGHTVFDGFRIFFAFSASTA